MSFRADFPQDLKSTGLTDQEVLERLEAGQDNNTYLQTSRSYRQILSENLFTFVNGVFFLISFVMIKLDRISDGILVVIVIFGGVLVNIYQEIWACLLYTSDAADE